MACRELKGWKTVVRVVGPVAEGRARERSESRQRLFGDGVLEEVRVEGGRLGLCLQ